MNKKRRASRGQIMNRRFFLTAFFLFASQMLFAADSILDLNAIDTTVNPCENFYQYACGNWIKNFQLPADHPYYNRQISGLSEQITKQLSTILSDYAQGKHAVKAKYAQSLGDNYASCTNVAEIEKLTPAYVKAMFNEVDAIKTPDDLVKLIAKDHLRNVEVFFVFGSQPDFDNSNQTISSLYQAGLSFDNRSYYFDQDPKSQEILLKFTEHVQKMFAAAGDAHADQTAKTLLKVETEIAQFSLDNEDLQDSTEQNHPMSLNEVKSAVPNFNWDLYLQKMGVAHPQKINLALPDFFKGLNDFLKTASMADLKVYLKWQILHHLAPHLGSTYHNEDFSFWGHYLGGSQTMSERWKYCTRKIENGMSDALGEAYVNSFPNAAQTKIAAESMIQEIKKAFGQNLQTVTWLDQQTRDAALTKLSLVTNKVGYPSKWANFDGLKINPKNFIANVIAMDVWSVRRDLNKIDRPTNRSDFGMPPWEQNAYYDPSNNEMVFPLGSMISPIFDASFSLGANYGSYGGNWMGHELSHGFDSNGRHFDGHGNLVNWWTDQTAKEFDTRTQCLIDQANHYEVLPGLFVNGKQTLTENLADQGGVKVGYYAWKNASMAKPSKSFGPYTEAQQYWLAFAQSYCSKAAPEYTTLIVTTDVHPPDEFRTNGVLMNRPEFAKDFACQAGSRMAPVNACVVW
jgi:predicted metalloendopeptidase